MNMFSPYDIGFANSPKNRPHYHCVPDYWDHIFKKSDYRVFQFVYFHIADLVASNTSEVRKWRKRANGGVWCSNNLIAKRTGLSDRTIDRALTSIEASGLLIRVNRHTHKELKMRRVFFVNHVLLSRLDKAWMSVRTDAWHEEFDTYEEYEDALQLAVEQEWSAVLAEGRDRAIEALITECGVDVGYPAKMTGYGSHFGGHSKIYSDDRLLEVSSSKKPAVSGETASAVSQTVPSSRLMPQGLLTPQAAPCQQEEKTPRPQESLNTTFRRRPAPEQTPVHKEPFAFSRAEKQIMDHWNRKESLRTHKLPGRGEPSNTILSFRAALKKIMDGTLFKGLEDTAQEHARAYSVAEVVRAIDAFAVADPALRKGVGIDDFFFNPNRAGGRNGFGRSWFLSALHGDIRSAVGEMTDHYPDLTEHLRKKFAYTILKGNPMPLDTIDKNNMVKAAAMIMELYHEHEEQLSRLNQTPEVIANKLMEHAARWNRNGATTPSTLCQPTLFKALRVELTKNGYLRQDETLTEDTPEPMGRVGDIIADTRTPEEKEKDRIRAMVISWPEAVRESMMKTKGIPLDILD